ncbi:hypothetical protein ACJMK2_043990 [Sinanodonta woodiana]|uniref:Uncharacterized protein n=1 Tax=Sinanodonta woodiana TaxID=1069815 RepID=A0ABD3VYM8_SINWO
MTGDSTFPRTLLILFLHFRLNTRGVKSCTDESTCSSLKLLEPDECHKEGILSKCCLSCEKILREKKGFKSCTDESTCSSLKLLEPDECHKEGILSKCCLSCEIILREKKGKVDDQDHSKPLKQQDTLHQKNKAQSISINTTLHPSNEMKDEEKARRKSTRSSTYLRTLSTSDANVHLENTPSTPFTDMYHEQKVTVYNTDLIIGTNMALVVCLTIIAILGIVIWKKAHRSRRHETIQVTDRRGTPVPPPRRVSSKVEKETSNQSSDDTYDFICDAGGKDIENPTDRTYMELIGNESPSLFGSTCIPMSSESQRDELTLLTDDNYVLPVTACIPHTREHDELETGNDIPIIKPQNCVERENIHRTTT